MRKRQTDRQKASSVGSQMEAQRVYSEVTTRRSYHVQLDKEVGVGIYLDKHGGRIMEAGLADPGRSSLCRKAGFRSPTSRERKQCGHFLHTLSPYSL